MIAPYGEIVAQHYEHFQQLGFTMTREEAYCVLLETHHVRIALTLEQYTTSDILLTFIDQNDKQYPLWMVRLMLDMDSYNRDRAILCEIKEEYGLRDGSRGCACFDTGVKRYTVTYLTQALNFLNDNLQIIDLECADFGRKPPETNCVSRYGNSRVALRSRTA